MKAINDYSIYCTSEQTRKAILLGAPIYPTSFDDCGIHQLWDEENRCYYDIPTTGQLFGWLEEQGIFVSIQRIKCCDKTFDYHYVIEHDEIGYLTDGLWTFDTRKEAILAAIDKSLDYLSNNKE